MTKAAGRKQIPYYLLYLLVCCIPFSFSLMSLCIVLLTLAWLLSGNVKHTLQNLRERKALWPFIIFYLAHAASYCYSSDKAQSLFDLEQKLSLLVLPVLVGAGMDIESKAAEPIFFFFSTSITAIAAFCIGRASSIYLARHDAAYFFYHQLVYGFDANAVYMSWYAIFSLLLLLFFSWTRFFKERWRPLLYFYIAIQLCFLVLLSSKTLIALFFLLSALYATPRIFRSRRFGRKEISLIAACIAIIGLIAFTNNPIRQRYAGVVKEYLNNKGSDSDIKNSNSGNLTIRLFLWRLGIENIREHNLWWYGAGNGDVPLLQNKKLAAHGVTDIYNPDHRSNLYNVNLHNMYLETLFMLGIPGLVLLLIIVFSPFFYYRDKHYRRIYIIFCVVGAIFLFQEAAFQTEAGIVYYVLFMQIFISIHYTNRHLEPH